MHLAAAHRIVHRHPGLVVRVLDGSVTIDEGVQPDLSAAIAMANDALAWHPDATRVSIGDGHGVRWLLDVQDGWTAIEGTAGEPSGPPLPWSPRVDRPAMGSARLVAGATPPGVSFAPTLDTVTERIDLACPACIGTHDVRDVDIEDLVYLVLGHGLRFPTADDLERAGDPLDGRC